MVSEKGPAWASSRHRNGNRTFTYSEYAWGSRRPVHRDLNLLLLDLYGTVTLTTFLTPNMIFDGFMDHEVYTSIV